MFKGLGNLANIGSLVKQAQEMGGKMQQLTLELKTKRVTGSAGAGMVEVDANGMGEILSVRIDPALFAKQDREMVEDLLPAAINTARQKAQELYAQEMQSLTGLSVPGLNEALSQLGNSPGP